MKTDPLGRPGIKYFYDVVCLGTFEPWGESGLYDLAAAGRRGFRVIHVFEEPNPEYPDDGPCCLVEMAYTDNEPEGSWKDQPEIKAQPGAEV